mgnify:CR=1 FL=1
MHKQKMGVGHNLRLEFIDEFLQKKPDVNFVEIIGDNWLSEGPHHKKLELVRKDYQVLMHFVGMNIGGTAPMSLSYLKKIRQLVNIYEPKHISDHLALQHTEKVYFHDLLPFPLTSCTLIRCTEKLLKIQDHLNLKIDFLVENLSYYIEFNDSDMSEHDFLNELVKATDTFILLDFNNLWCNEENLGHDASYYLKSIDWRKVKEAHIAGPDKVEDILLDTHGSYPSRKCLTYVNKSSEKLANIPIVYERDNNLPAYCQLLSETKQIDRLISGKNYEL